MKKNYLLSMDQHFFDEIQMAAKKIDLSVASYIRGACRIHLHIQKKYLEENIVAVKEAKRAVEEKFLEVAEQGIDVYSAN